MNIQFNYTKEHVDVDFSPSVDVFGAIEQDIIYTFSGKSALSLILGYLRNSGKLENKSAEVLVPRWLGYWVYMIMHKFCFPSSSITEVTRGIMVYHQWGFPQDLDYIKDFCSDKKLFLIEDCAHSINSFYKGQRLGTFGDMSLFSLAKFFPCVVGGAIYVKDKQAKNELLKMIEIGHESHLAEQAFNHRVRYDVSSTHENKIILETFYAIYDKLLKIPEQSLAVVHDEIKNNALEIRKQHFKLYRDALVHLDYAGDLFSENVIPWVVPIFIKENVHQKIIDKLRQRGVESGTYLFDINRNMLKPHFKKCLILPCHQGMQEEDITDIISIIKNNI